MAGEICGSLAEEYGGFAYGSLAAGSDVLIAEQLKDGHAIKRFLIAASHVRASGNSFLHLHRVSDRINAHVTPE